MNIITPNLFYLHFVQRFGLPAHQVLSIRSIKDAAEKEGYNIEGVWHPVAEPQKALWYINKDIKEFENTYKAYDQTVIVLNVSHMGQKSVERFADRQLEHVTAISHLHHPRIVFCKAPKIKMTAKEWIEHRVKETVDEYRKIIGGLVDESPALDQTNLVQENLDGVSGSNDELKKLEDKLKRHIDSGIAVCRIGQEATTNAFLELLHLRRKPETLIE